jgi:FAD/FMN-containing dehydrogenase/Fe-S oxidoreductase
VTIDSAGLAAALRVAVRGEVRFDAGTRAMYATDASNYRQVPTGVVLPRDAGDVEAALAVCRRFAAPVFSRGGGTSLAGESCNVAVVLDFSKYMHRIVEIDWENRRARVEPGCVTDALRHAAAARNLTFGPDPATHDRNTFGGMIGNNSCGMHAQMAGKTDANVESLDIVTYDGLRTRVGPTGDAEFEAIVCTGGRRAEIYAGLRALRDRYADRIRARFPKIPRRVSGFALDQLLAENGFNVARALVGTESTCVTVVEATVRLVHSPPYRALALLGFADLASAGDCVAHCNEHAPIALEGIADSMFEFLALKGQPTHERAIFPPGRAWLICEFGGESQHEASGRARALTQSFAGAATVSAALVEDTAAQARLWAFRDNALGATSKVPHHPDFYPGWEDSAVDPARLGSYLRAFEAMLDEYGYHGSIYGHFGQGCVHVSIDFDLFTAAGVAKYREFVTAMAHVCVDAGGSLSGEHGDGQARGELLPIMYGDDLVAAFWEFKTIWDPANRMNPGKVVRPNALDRDLRWGPAYRPAAPVTHFSFIDDDGSFGQAANRCVGTGKCRKQHAGTMCPSYMATKEEAYSTRGRARLLFEMLRGEPIEDGWQNETVKDALDLCLSCKACKRECPVNVDMATYKAEFLAHYYARKRRPLSAYAFAYVPWLSRIGSVAPAIANALAQAPLLDVALKAAAGIAPQRRIPLFGAQTFRAWFARRVPQPRDAPNGDVILWPDTWNDNFHPSTAQAAVLVLEDAGFRVRIPCKPLCCGRPLYDYGMLDLAKSLLGEIVDALRPQLRDGTSVVGLEPSCVSVFRDELPNLLAGDPDAERLRSQTYLLPEFLARKARDYAPPPLHRRALVQRHCHHQAVLDASAENALFASMGLAFDLPDSGCCGMAGPFGFDAVHYDVSRKLGERVLMPLVRAADPRTLIVADGFSCREQIAQTSNRQALHPAQVLAMAIEGDAPDDDAFPERRYLRDPAAGRAAARRRGTLLLAGVAALPLAAAVGLMRRDR